MDGEIQKNEEYQEIDLRKAIGFFFQKMPFIIGIAAFSAVGAAIVSFSLPKIYMVSSSLEIGTTIKDGNEQPVESVGQVVEKKNNDVYGVLVRQKLNMSQADYPRITTENGPGTNIITFTTQSTNPDRAKKVFEEINATIIADHQKKFDVVTKEINDNIAVENDNKTRIVAKIDSLEAEEKIYQSQVVSFQREVTANFGVGTEFMLFSAQEQMQNKKQEIENLYSVINDSDRKISALQAQLGSIKMTSVAKQPTTSEKPVSPKVMLNAGLAAVLGFFFGIFWVFGVEWWKKNA